MKIVIPEYIKNYDLCPIKNEEEALNFNLSFNNTNDIDYIVHWGNHSYSVSSANKYGVMETGFFNNAAFIDTVGNYQFNSLNTKYAYDNINEFELKGRKSAKEIVFNLPESKQSKYNAAYGDIKCVDENIILALQNPKDRSIHSVSNSKTYYKFVEECCKFYGKNLFVKMHPWNSGEYYDILGDICKKYNCNYGKAPISVIRGKEFVISYNSTFAIDCILNDVPYVQYEMGTFYNTFGIIYSNRSFPTKITPIKDSEKLANFLIYKYCFNKGMNGEKYARMIKHFANSNDIFPMNDEFCYANNI
jgi:hypothetical protein